MAMDGSDLEKRVRELETAQATQAAAQAGMTATHAAMQAGTMATMAAGAAGFITGVFMGLAIAASRR